MAQHSLTVDNSSHHHNNKFNRTIAHFDLDAFYVACERELNPNRLLNVPVAVSQYNPHGKLQDTHSSEVDRRLVAFPRKINNQSRTKCDDAGSDKTIHDTNGSMIAVSYEARAGGVQRGDRGLDAIRKCPGLHIVQVPVKRGKADLTMYRSASSRVMESLISSILSCCSSIMKNEGTTSSSSKKGSSSDDYSSYSRSNICVEKASIDEIYVDLTIPVREMTEQICKYRDSDLDDVDDVSNDETDTNIGMSIWNEVLQLAAHLEPTTVGGLEVLSAASLAERELSKKELSKGSHLQVLDAKETQGEYGSCGGTPPTGNTTDAGSKSWWQRSLNCWSDTEISLACGSALAAKARMSVAASFRKSADIFTLSAGISTNKTLAKLASGLKKPNAQCLINPLDEHALSTLFHPLSVGRLRGLGGKFGSEVCTTLNIKTVGDLAKVPLTKLEATYPPSADSDVARFLFSIARGICTEEVSERTVEKTMSSGKTFRGKLALPALDEDLIKKRLEELCNGLIERLEIDRSGQSRRPTLMVISVKFKDSSASISRSSKIPKNFNDYKDAAMKLFQSIPLNKGNAAIPLMIIGLTVSATSFIEVASGKSSIMSAFHRAESNNISPTPNKRKRIISQSTSSCTKKTGSLEDLWLKKGLSAASPKTLQSNKKMDLNRRDFKRKENGSPMKSWLSKEREPTSVKPSKGLAQHDFQREGIRDIDPTVLAELPKHIQAMIKQDTQQMKKKKNSIETYFGTQCKTKK